MLGINFQLEEMVEEDPEAGEDDTGFNVRKAFLGLGRPEEERELEGCLER
jgi:hypothetical protein